MPAVFDLPIEFARLHDCGITSRDLPTRPASVDAEARSFEAVVSTETRAQVIDWSRYEIIDEVLLARGGEFPEQVPLLPNHSRFSLDDVIGAAREFRMEGNQWVGRGYLAEPADDTDPVRRYWSRLEAGYINAVSIGYVVREAVDIQPGKKQMVAGKFYTAGERRLRVTTSWRVHELSLVPIGADSMALIRSHLGARRPQNRSYFR